MDKPEDVTLVVEQYDTLAEAIENGNFGWTDGEGSLATVPVAMVWKKSGGGSTGLPGSIEVSLAHAEYMAKSWNNHAGLIEALDNATSSLESVLAHYGPLMPDADRNSRAKVVTEARAVLAKANGA